MPFNHLLRDKMAVSKSTCKGQTFVLNIVQQSRGSHIDLFHSTWVDFTYKVVKFSCPWQVTPHSPSPLATVINKILHSD